MPNVFQCDGVIIPKDLKEKCKKIFEDFLERSPSHGDNLEKLSDVLWGIRDNEKIRVFFAYYQYEGKHYIVVLGDDTKHNYNQVSLLKDDVAKKRLEKHREEIAAVIKTYFLRKEAQKNNEAITYTKVYHYQDKWVILDEDQNEVLKASLPCVINGPAGSGKTFVGAAAASNAAEKFLTEGVKKYGSKGRILYVTESPYLANKVRQELQAAGKTHIEVLDYAALVYKLDVVELKSLAESQTIFKDWWLAYVKQQRLTLKEEILNVYQEFRNIPPNYSETDYIQALGQKQSLLFKKPNPQLQAAVYKAYQAWISHVKALETEFIFLTDFYPLKNIMQLECDFVVLDESDELSLTQIENITGLAKARRFMLLLDQRQNRLDDNQKLTLLKKRLHPCEYRELKGQYRCPKNVLKVAKVYNDMRLDLTPTNKSEALLEEIENHNPEEGEVFLVKNLEELKVAVDLVLKQENLDLLKDPNTCVVTSEEFIEEANALGFILVLTDRQIRGLQFKRIIQYKPFEEGIFQEANKELAKEEQLRERKSKYATAFASRFVTATRSEKRLYIVQEKKHQNENILNRLEKVINQDLKEQPSKKEEQLPKESLKEAWIKRLTELFEMGLDKEGGDLALKLKEASIISETDIQELKRLLRKTPTENTKEEEEKPQKKKKQETVKPKAIKNLSDATAKALFDALVKNNEAKIQALLKNNKAIKDHMSLANNQRISSLMIACENGYLDAVKALIAGGADIRSYAKKDNMTPLHGAMFTSNIEIVKLLIDAGANVNAVDKNNMTPVHLATIKNKKEIVEMLIEKGADLNIANNHGRTPLHTAVISGKVEVIEPLLAARVDLNAVDKDKETPLHMAVQMGYRKIVKILIAKGADLNIANNHGRTPLHMAVISGKVEVIEPLLTVDVDLNAVDKDKETPLHVAVQMRYLDIANMLIAGGADLNIANNKGRTPLHTAVISGKVEVIEPLLTVDVDLNAVDKDKETPLHMAVQMGYRKIVKILIAKGADLNIANNHGRTPLHMAVISGKVEVIEPLLTVDVDLNAVDKDKETPLHVAVQMGYLKIVKILIAKGADLNIANNHGETPLHVATLCNKLDIIEVLVSAGVNLNTMTLNGNTALHIAIGEKNIEIVRLLIKALKTAGLSLNTSDTITGYTPLLVAVSKGFAPIVKELIIAGADVNAVTIDMETALHLATFNNYIETLKILINVSKQQGIFLNLNALDKDKDTPLHIAASQGLLLIVKELIIGGADVNSVGHQMITPLHFATFINHIEAVKTLINVSKQQGIFLNLDALDKNKKTPLHMAAQKGYLEIVKLLIEAGANTTDLLENKQQMLTLLNHIYKNGDLESIMLLLEKDIQNKIEWDYKTPDNTTVLTILCKTGGTLACHILEKLLLKNINIDQLIEGNSAVALACKHAQFDLIKIFLEKSKESFYKMTNDPQKTIVTLRFVLGKIENDKNSNFEIKERLQAIVLNLEKNPNTSGSALTFSNISSQNNTNLPQKDKKISQAPQAH